MEEVLLQRTTANNIRLIPVYHHTHLLLFRPFLILKAKLDLIPPTIRTPTLNKLDRLAWLNGACENCLDTAQKCIRLVTKSCELDEICRVCSNLPSAQLEK